MSVSEQLENAQEAFTDGDWETAILHYTTAIKKLSDDSDTKALRNALFHKGMCLFHLEEYEAAVASFLRAYETTGSDVKAQERLRKWVGKCDDKTGNTTSLPELSSREEAKRQDAPAADETAKPQKGAASAAGGAVQKPVKQDWYQSPEAVTVTFWVKNAIQKDAKFNATARTLSVSIPLISGSTFVWDFDLFEKVDPNSMKTRFTPMKVEVVLQKLEPIHWPQLEASSEGVVPPAKPSEGTISAAAIPSKATTTSYPSSKPKKKDWTALEKEIEKELEDEKPEGEEALQALFRQIYANADDDTRRAMVKSFQTSGGTALSTNWSEVKEKNYEKEREAPEGMAWKKWGQGGNALGLLCSHAVLQ